MRSCGPSVGPVRYLAEIYAMPGASMTGAAALRAAATDRARVVGSIELPADETSFLVVEAVGESDVEALLTRAGLQVNRISTAVTECEGPGGFPPGPSRRTRT